MGEDEVFYLLDLYHENSGYKLQEYRLLLLEEIGLDVSEHTIFNVFQKLNLTVKKPEVHRYEKFYNRDGT
jgi:hypothetical protein